jgi:adenylate cyclase
MKIRAKIILITLPLIITPLFIILVLSILSARNGITNVATELLTFKTDVLTNYMDNQWSLLADNDLDGDQKFITISKAAVGSYSRTLIGSETERIFAVDTLGNLAMSSAEDWELSNDDKDLLREMIQEELTGWQYLSLGGKEMIGDASFFEPFDWYVMVSVEKDAFYGEITRIIYRTIIIFFIFLTFSVFLLFLFSSYLTRPLENIVDAIRKIIETNDLSTKVTLQYKDETGKLGHYFNIMTGELDKANNQMKKFALQAVIAKRKEAKIRNIFQKYVPKSVIDRFYSDPESMLIGENRVLAVLFSDIRDFTTISESLSPDELVESLNKYFETMVDVITHHGGIVDKYIGDAIMAFFGAPVKGSNDALSSVMAGLEMVEALDHFNEWQVRQGRHEFKIGIGINYGIVTIGNIGSEKKMDYTVIGDMVNLASRTEGLTKLYKEPLLISESLHRKVADHLPCRMMDRVVVKGKTQGVKIYSVKKELSPTVKKAWDYHEEGVGYYYAREFQKALACFQKTLAILKNDHSAGLFLEKCKTYITNPPPLDWNGDTVLNRK